MVSRMYLFQGVMPTWKLRRRTEVDCFLVDLFWALQILYQASFRFSPSLCLKSRASFSGDNGEDRGLAITTKQAKKRRTEKRGRIKRQGWSGGEENERQMANNVMREIRVCDGYLVCWPLRRLPGNGARNPSCYLLSTVLVFPWRGKGDAVKQRKYFPQFLRTMVSIQ